MAIRYGKIRQVPEPWMAGGTGRNQESLVPALYGYYGSRELEQSQ